MAPTKVFKVGHDATDDITPEQVELLTYKIRDWFSSDACTRVYEDPTDEAREQVQQCLLGVTKDHVPWGRAPKTLAGRVRAKCMYDMDKDAGIQYKMDDRLDVRRARERDEVAQAAKDATAPGGKLVNAQLDQYRMKLEAEIIAEYPELDTPVHRPNIRRLSLLYSQQEKVSMELDVAKATTRKTLIDTLATIQKTVESVMKSLDIYPDQIRKRMDQQRKGSIGDLVVEVESDEDFAKREKLWSLTEALQLWWMTQHLNGNKTGPQIHEFEMWHMTRCRPIDYKCECGREVVLVEGFTPDELRDYLVENGVLVEKPVIPQLIPEGDLDGLAELGNTSAPDEGESLPDDVELGGEAASDILPGSDGGG